MHGEEIGQTSCAGLVFAGLACAGLVFCWNKLLSDSREKKICIVRVGAVLVDPEI